MCGTWSAPSIMTRFACGSALATLSTTGLKKGALSVPLVSSAGLSKPASGSRSNWSASGSSRQQSDRGAAGYRSRAGETGALLAAQTGTEARRQDARHAPKAGAGLDIDDSGWRPNAERFADFPLVAERIDDPPKTPAVLIADG